MPDVTVVSLALAVLALFVATVSVLLVWRRSGKNRGRWDVYDLNALLDDIGRRVRKAEEGIMDLKVKLEVLELRSVKNARSASAEAIHMEAGRVTAREGTLPGSREGVVAGGGLGGSSVHGLTETKDRILDLLRGSRDGLTAKEVRDSIGLSREHVARTMNLLFHDGVIERKAGSKPFVYVVGEGHG